MLYSMLDGALLSADVQAAGKKKSNIGSPRAGWLLPPVKGSPKQRAGELEETAHVLLTISMVDDLGSGDCSLHSMTTCAEGSRHVHPACQRQQGCCTLRSCPLSLTYPGSGAGTCMHSRVLDSHERT